MDESRRSLVKKGVVGAGVAWATPVIQTLRIPAYGAAGTPEPTTTIPPMTCATPSTCPDFTSCGAAGSSRCVCIGTTEGSAVCADAQLPPCAPSCPPFYTCDPVLNACVPPLCVGSGECPAGFVCADLEGCGVKLCLPLATPAQCAGATAGASDTPTLLAALR
jgi:hypothetical protein